MSTDSGTSYYTKCTGTALSTVENHTAPSEITLFGSCFCPFVQRVWVALEFLEIPYQYYEVDPYKKPAELLEISPKSLVPALKLNGYSSPRSVNESTVILDFLEDLAANTTKRSLLPPITNPYARAMVRLQSDHVNKNLVPAFYRYLQTQDHVAQIDAGIAFHDAVKGLTDLFQRAERELLSGGGAAGLGEARAMTVGLGLYFNDEDLGWIDLMVGPWLFRATNVLKHYRGFTFSAGTKFNNWVEKLLNHPAFKATCSTEDLYLGSYMRYAFNRPNTSQVAEAIVAGRPLP